MVLSKSKKFIFIHIPKVAGTSVRRLIWPYKYRISRPSRVLRDVNQMFNGPLNSWSWKEIPYHTPFAQIEGVIPPEILRSYWKFAFVRNPWDWLVSYYTFVLKFPTHPHFHLARYFNDFSLYVKWRVENRGELQSDYVLDREGRMAMNFIGRYENLADDLRHVCATLGIPFALPHLNASKHEDYRCLYNDETAQLVAQAFSRDIELFGYTFDGLKRDAPILVEEVR